MRLSWFFPSLLALTCFGLTLSACNSRGEAERSRQQRAAEGSKEALPQLGQVPSYQGKGADERLVDLASFRGAPLLVGFFFTRCPSICPRVMAQMNEVRKATQEGSPELQLVAISVDPEFDTPSVLKAYAERLDLKHPRLWLLSGEATRLTEVVESGFRIALAGKADAAKEHYGITHGSHLALVDASGSIRTYFRSSDADLPLQVSTSLKKLKGLAP